MAPGEENADKKRSLDTHLGTHLGMDWDWAPCIDWGLACNVEIGQPLPVGDKLFLPVGDREAKVREAKLWDIGKAEIYFPAVEVDAHAMGYEAEVGMHLAEDE
jgi:hypothetical protein